MREVDELLTMHDVSSTSGTAPQSRYPENASPTRQRPVTYGAQDPSSRVAGDQDSRLSLSLTDTSRQHTIIRRIRNVVTTFSKFIGPGFMIAVAYSELSSHAFLLELIADTGNKIVDPGNYATDIAAGASYRFRLLFIVLLSNIFAIFLQSLCIKLGTVTGLNLAEACRAFLPRWMNYALYVLAEVAIIATDLAEVRQSFPNAETSVVGLSLSCMVY